MKKFLSIAMICAVALVAASCGGGEKKSNSKQATEQTAAEQKIKPSTTNVSGDMRGCFKVVDREYKVRDDWGKKVIVTLERTDKELPFDFKEYEIASYGTYSTVETLTLVGFSAEFYDEDGDVVVKADLESPYSHEEAPALVELEEGETGTITFSIYGDAKEIASIKTFKISSGFEISVPADSDDDDDDLKSAWDEVKDEYESAWDEVEDEYEAAKQIVKGSYKAAAAAASYYGEDLEDELEAVAEEWEDAVDEAVDEWEDALDDLGW